MEQEQTLLPALQNYNFDALPSLTADLNDTQIAWVALADVKQELFKDLEKRELDIQKTHKEARAILVKPAEGLPKMQTDLKALQGCIKGIKSSYGVLEDQRKQFTGFIDAVVITPAMQYEKRCKGLIMELDSHELTQRKIVESKESKANKIVTEREAYRAHINNEYFRQQETFKQMCRNLILDSYKLALQQDKRDTINYWKNDLIAQLRSIELVEPRRYDRQYIPDEEAVEIINSIEPYSLSEDLEHAINVLLPEVYGMYDQDIKNKSKALAAVATQQATENAVTQQAIQIEAAANMLVAETVGQIQSTAKVKIKMGVIAENTPQWAIAVITAFYKNWSACQEKLKVKEWKNLKLEQMAEALGKVATERGKVNNIPGGVYDGLTLEKIEK